uniref:Rad4 beta-hairpin domain-containing protein n=1 Tax=Alexandrium monilatum TaxID=311494 RepID=A0A7S4Q1Z6_9DINO
MGPAASLDGFLAEEAGGAPLQHGPVAAADDEDDEYADIDWCDAAELPAVHEALRPVPSGEEAARVAEGAGPRCRVAPVRLAPAPAEPPPVGAAPAPATCAGAAAVPPEERKRRAKLRRVAAERHHTLALCFAARLRALTEVCDDTLVQAVALSRWPRLEPDAWARELVRPRAEDAGRCRWPASLAAGAARRCSLIAALNGGRQPTPEDVALLLVARCRAEAVPARVVMALPLPPVKKCASLLVGGLLPEPVVWPEVFNHASSQWIAKMDVGGFSDERQGDTRAAIWVLAAGECGGLRDVTPRYCTRWTSVVGARGSLAKGWDAFVRRFAGTPGPLESGRLPGTTETARADRLDEEALQRRARREPLPTSRTGFKRHSGYVLESQLRQHEVVHPLGTKPVGLFRGQEPIYRRADVAELLTQAQWRRKGRCVREGERAHKTLRGGNVNMATLFGFWQTEELPDLMSGVPEAELQQGGPIPCTNNHGNVELLDAGAAERLPPGTRYLADEAAISAAGRLGVPHAPAVVGFHRKQGLLRPRFGGVVVWERDEARVAEAAVAERERLQALEERQRAERLEATWRLLVKNVLVDIYVEARYSGGGQPITGASAPVGDLLA